MSAKPDAGLKAQSLPAEALKADVLPAEIMAARIKAAQLAAAQGGWPEGAMCSITGARKTRWAWTVATFFGAGFGKPGPGTWGSAAATLLWTLAVLPLHPAPVPLLLWTLAAAAIATAIGVPAATIAAREAHREDPGFVVIDEVAGQWITLLAIPIGQLLNPAFATHARPDAGHIILAFLLFRLFDVFKPYPIRRLENLPEGWGIIFDDIAAGLYAGAVLLILSHWL